MAEQRDPYDGDYVGNIFGWKLSMVGLLLIVLLASLAAYRHYSLDVPIGFEDPLENQKDRFAPASRADLAKDSLDLKE